MAGRQRCHAAGSRRSIEFLAAGEHGGTEEGIPEVGGAAEPAAGAEHGGHRALEDVQALLVLEVPGADQVGQEVAVLVVDHGALGHVDDEVLAAVAVLGQAMDTVNIKAGLSFDAAVARPVGDSGPAKLLGLSMRTGPATAITLSRTFDGALRLRELAEPVREETKVAAGKMEGSLYESAAAAGATQSVTAEVVKLFAHKLDFSRDIKAED
mgnify:CR=1 FL=1